MMNNTFTNCDNAYNFEKVSNLLISDNVFNSNNSSASSFLKVDEGNCYLFRNNIVDQSSSDVFKAFEISGLGNVYAGFNNFSSNGTSTMFNISSKAEVILTENNSINGYCLLAGVNYHNSFGNDIYGTGNDIFGNNRRYAYVTTLSNGRYCSNKGAETETIFKFNGNCMNTDFSNNEIGNPSTIAVGTGVKVDDVIGIQLHKANLWNSTFAEEGATNTSNDPFFSLMRINSNSSIGGNPLFIPQNNNYSPINWFAENNSTSFASCQSTNLTNPNDPSTDKTLVDVSLINGNYNVTPLSNWIAQKTLIRKVMDNPNLLNDVEVNTWYQAQQGLPVYVLAQLEDAVSDYYGRSTEVSDLRVLFEQYASSPSNPLLESNIETIMNTVTNRQPSIRISVHTSLSALSPSNDYELYAKNVYGIYIKILEDNEYVLTNSERQEISELSNLCPLTYGRCIFLARSIADGNNITYDEENCNTSRGTKRSYSSDVPKELIVYPNPASQTVSIQSEIEIKIALIFDLSGKLIKKSTSNTFDISSIENGLYIIECHLIDGSTVSNKLRIAH